jgi:DNA-binding MarR family transcriptional regulator
METADKYAVLQRGAALIRSALPGRASVEELSTRTRRARPELLLEVKWAPSGAQRMHQTLHLFGGELPERFASQPNLVWVAPDDLDRAALAALRSAGISFVQPGSGIVHIIAPGIVIDRTMSPMRARRSRAPATMTDPFGDNASRIVRTLLRTALSPLPRPWGVRELAVQTGVDRTTTSEVLRWLEQHDLVTRERRPGHRGRAVAVRIVEPIRVLERWSASYDWTANARLAVHAPIGSPERFVSRLTKQFKGIAWAVTLQAAAAALAPHATWDRMHVYVDAADESALQAIAAREEWPASSDGKLVLMAPYYRKTVWGNTRAIHRMPIVDIVQLLLDLWRYPVRGREQAEHLLEIRRQLPPALFDSES